MNAKKIEKNMQNYVFVKRLKQIYDRDFQNSAKEKLKVHNKKIANFLKGK